MTPEQAARHEWLQVSASKAYFGSKSKESSDTQLNFLHKQQRSQPMTPNTILPEIKTPSNRTLRFTKERVKGNASNPICSCVFACVCVCVCVRMSYSVNSWCPFSTRVLLSVLELSTMRDVTPHRYCRRYAPLHASPCVFVRNAWLSAGLMLLRMRLLASLFPPPFRRFRR